MNSIENILASLKYFYPELALTITFFVLLLADLFSKGWKYLLPAISLAGFLITGFLLIYTPDSPGFLFTTGMANVGLYVVDPFAFFFKVLILLSIVYTVLFSLSSKEILESKENRGEYYVLLSSFALGTFLLTSTIDLLMMYLSFELVSLSSYVLAGFTRKVPRSSEASLKYIIFGAIASGAMLFGISIIYGLTGTTNIYLINFYLTNQNVSGLALIIAGILLIGGIGFKISMAPFHFWTPDVYEGAPITITAVLSVASKAAGFAVLIRFLKVMFIDFSMTNLQSSVWAILPQFKWNEIIAGLAVLTMTLGNLVALWQSNMKRMLAYSSIAHAGYMLSGFVILDNQGIMAILIYFFIYLFMNLGAFFVVMLISDKLGSEEMDDYTGLGYKAPFLTVALTIFLVSLTGIPPTAGFIAKLYLFGALVKANWIWLAVIGVLNSVISLYYYLKVVKNMFLRESQELQFNYKLDTGNIILSLTLIIPTLLFGIYFKPIVEFAEQSIKIFGF
ncbi:MAG: NADH-quinone oxidoreductase subunit N [Ignavibacteria bacterium]|nr:NADH-quinone oxidoreductase subunit N [Ignavibacteria bacterium]